MQQRILVGLIGANILKSLSPAMFEQACASIGIQGHYHLMDLDQIRTFDRIAQDLSFTKAAARLNVTQATVSMRIRAT